MILESARSAARQIFDPPFRGVLFKSLGATLAALTGLWFLVAVLFGKIAEPWLAALWPGMPDWAGWLGTVATVLAGVALALGLAILIAPVTALVASLFLDEIAEVVESEDYPDRPTGRALPFVRSLIGSVQFLFVVLVGNLLALLLLLVPGVNFAAFFIVNGYLLGREYFEFAAARHMPQADARAFRRRHAMTVFMAGLVVAGFLAVPLLNLLTPLFAAAMMVHLFQAISQLPPERSGLVNAPKREIKPGR
jgi:CysZ protein